MAKLPPIPERLRKIDELTRQQHTHICSSDDCYYLWEWDGAPYAQSAVTDFIGNFQKDTKFRGQNPWFYKTQAMSHAAKAISATMLPEWKGSIFVPIPPSKIAADPRYDPRLLMTLGQISPAVNICELVAQTSNAESRQKGISPEGRAQILTITAAAVSLTKNLKHIVVFDDVLSGGSHFSAIKGVILKQFPGTAISGLFLARRVLPTLIADPSE